jgi:hypothetical protein
MVWISCEAVVPSVIHHLHHHHPVDGSILNSTLFVPGTGFVHHCQVSSPNRNLRDTVKFPWCVCLVKIIVFEK